jgi:hypothetical protein
MALGHCVVLRHREASWHEPDMQNLFASETPWHTPWMERAVPVVVRIVELCPSRTVFTRFIPPHRPDQMPGSWALLRTLGRVFGS